ncbi:PREDICTED: cilia- and flagella-associated protein 20-like [Dinoponera quadriceps]|uniref:Cilia- and flagella-associated protein 20-like n=1 Tax=Dinoponera quadriceps TaxID=609295 RepID=A0A6P3XC59_DINQU|nr:PREDICTED: cilia- and flagella-associated protein 20-like [Dinoponera quadriceps]
MFRNTFQSGFLSILYSCGSSPLELWDMHVKNGYIRRIMDEEIKSLALEIAGTNVATTYIFCPADPKKVLAIRLPFLILIVKNMKKYFTFEITILDDKNMHRRFRVSNFQSATRVRPFCTSMPIGLLGGWNQIQFNLCDFTRRAYGTNYIETTRMQVHANCRIRRIYFADRLYSEDELPEDFRLFFPVHRKKCVREEVPKIPSVELEKPPSIERTPSIETEITEEKPIKEPEIPKDEAEPEEPFEEPEEAKEVVEWEDEEEERFEEEEEVEAVEEVAVLDEGAEAVEEVAVLDEEAEAVEEVAVPDEEAKAEEEAAVLGEEAEAEEEAAVLGEEAEAEEEIPVLDEEEKAEFADEDEGEGERAEDENERENAINEAE